jgi:hypothetical protein
MKHYRHMITMREKLLLERRQARVQAGYDLLIALFICLSISFISVMVLS